MPDGALPAPLALGDVLAGKYRIEKVLGVGGMGVVVAARHLELHERVAVKFLLPDIAENAEAVARFLHEGRAAVKIRSEHVARVLDVGRLDSGAPFMVMEYLEGEDIAQMLERGPLPIELAVDYLLQALEAIAEAHSLGIVHRDLKPSNLFVTRRADGTPGVKVLDFGIAKTLEGRGVKGNGLTSTTNVMGTPLYMSPEQLASSRDVDVRADVWALGVILFEMLTTEAPFFGDTMPQLCTAITSIGARRVVDLRSEVPRALDAAIARCLEKRADARFADVGELAAAIAPFASQDGRASADRVRRVLATRARSFAETTPGLAPAANGAVTSSGVTLPRARAGSRGAVVGVAIGLLGGLAVGVSLFVIARSRGAGAQPTPEAASASVASVAITPSPSAMPSGAPSNDATGPRATSVAATGTPTTTAAASISPSAAATSSATATPARRPPPPKRPSPGGLDLPEGRK